MQQADTIIKTFASVLVPVVTNFSWRPQLADPNDEMVLEAAVNGQVAVLVTFNTRHFAGAAQRFGIAVLKSGEFLRSMRP